MIGEFRDQRPRLRAEESIRRRPNKHIQCANERDIDEQPRAKWLRSEANFLQHPPAEILQGENVTAPATDKATKDQRSQDSQSKEDESRVNEPALQRMHRFRRLDGRNRPPHDPP